MANLSFGKTLSLEQAKQVILATPENRYMLRSEPRIGKSSLLKELSKALPDHEVAYIDVPNLDLGDIAMPVIDHETKTTKYYPNARFNMHKNKPVIMMLDEFSKGADPIKNMLHPLLEKANPRLGDLPVHDKSIIFLTGNMGSDGVGDTMKMHSVNRIVPLNLHKSDADSWLKWAINNGIAPEVCAWVNRFQHVMASYLEGNQDDNPYIFNPKKVQAGFCSPRSLETVSNIVKKRDLIDEDTLICAMTGAIGEAGSRDLQSFIAFSDQLPIWENMINNPKTALVPTSAGACAIVVFSAISKVGKDSIDKFMEYLERFESEWQACFAINIAKSPTKQSIAFSSSKFTNWVTKNEDLL